VCVLLLLLLLFECVRYGVVLGWIYEKEGREGGEGG
jgi:hypothetical protein